MNLAQPDGSTLGVSGADRDARSGDGVPGPAVLAALTVLYHPDLRRVGDRALLSEVARGQEALVSRNAPELVRPGHLSGEPLAEPHLSRRPLRFQATDNGGIQIDLGGSRTSVIADGKPVQTRAAFSAEAVERGVVLELAGRVVVLLHWTTSPPGPPPPRCGLIGDSARLWTIREDVERIADLKLPVLLRGESGTGKELVARAIHETGPRRAAPFVGVNLGAIPASLAASQIFGAVRGAFTGSVAAQEGFFRSAHGGTLFLDEVGDAPPEVQVLLLRALETGEIYPVGSATPVRADVRIIAATDADLEAKIATGEFRAPLLHRLAGFEIRLPPLRERRDDVGRLVLHFLRQELDQMGEGARVDPVSPAFNPEWLPPAVVARLSRFDWPGNVRQLRNVVRQLAIASRGFPALDASRLESLLSDRRLTANPASGSHPLLPAPPPDRPARRKPSGLREEEILEALRACRWDLQAAADRLHISRPSLYVLIDGSSRIRKASDLTPEEIERCHRACQGDLDAMVERLEVSKRALGRRVRELKLA